MGEGGWSKLESGGGEVGEGGGIKRIVHAISENPANYSIPTKCNDFGHCSLT